MNSDLDLRGEIKDLFGRKSYGDDLLLMKTRDKSKKERIGHHDSIH